jgi:rhamnulose-1-phosphate aldolase
MLSAVFSRLSVEGEAMHVLPKSLEPQLSDIARIAGMLDRRGWAERNAGNISWAIDYSDDKKNPQPAFLITARNARMRDIARDPACGVLLITADPDTGTFELKAGCGEPTSEVAMHLRLQQQLRLRHADERVILHTHPRYITALTHHPEYRDENAINRLLRSMHPEISVFLWEGIGWAPFEVPGSVELAKAAELALTNHHVALLDRHGVIATGNTPDETFDRIDLAERGAEMWFLCHSAGFDPIGLSSTELDRIAGMYHSERL